MENKKVIEKLQSYFIKQNPQDTARACANFIIDLNRFLYLDRLSQEEKDHLIQRTELNIKQVYKFIKDDNNEHLKLINIDHLNTDHH